MKPISTYFMIFFLIFAGLAFAFFTPIKFLINFAHDDSFFYIKTAYNFSSGLGSTFDQVNRTNGYHPLWFLFLSTYFFLLNNIINFSPDTYFRFVVMIHFFICVLTLFFVLKIFRLKKNNSQYLKQFFLFVPLFIILVFTRDFGMESQLLCLIFSIYLYLKSKEVFEEKNYAIYKIILLNIIFLTRVDYISSIIPLMIISDYFTSGNKGKKNFVIYCVISILCVSSGYFLFNKLTYGHFLTISATLKNSFPDILLFRNLQDIILYGFFLASFIKFLFISIVILLFSILRYKKNDTSRVDRFLFGSGGGTLLFIVLNLSFNSQSLREWYVTFPTFVTSLLFIYSFGFSKAFFFLKMGILLVSWPVYFYLLRMNNFKWDSSYDYAINLKRETMSEDRIFQIDFSGVVGFFSERKIIDGDGLINSFEYLDYLKNNNLKSYFRDKEINLYSTHSENGKHYQITDSSGSFIDKFYSNRFGGYPFIFSHDSNVFQMSFDYVHILYKTKGNWYLFKIPK